MVNAKEWLDKRYPIWKRSQIIELGISNQWLTGSLDLTSFVNLEKLVYSLNGSVKEIDLTGLKKLKKVIFKAKKWVSLEKLDLSKCPNLRNLEFLSITCYCPRKHNFLRVVELNCRDNFLTDLGFLNYLNENLTKIDVRNNKFRSDLTPFRRFTNLEELQIGNNDFYGNLEPLKNLTKLKKISVNNTSIGGSLQSLQKMNSLSYLNVSNTDIDSGLEYLPNSLTKKEWQNTAIEIITNHWKEYFSAENIQPVLPTNWKEQIRTQTTQAKTAQLHNNFFQQILTERQTKAINEIQEYWKQKSHDGKIGSKLITEVLGENWQSKIRNQNRQETVNAQQSSYQKLIDQADQDYRKAQACKFLKDEFQIPDHWIQQIIAQEKIFNEADYQTWKENKTSIFPKLIQLAEKEKKELVQQLTDQSNLRQQTKQIGLEIINYWDDTETEKQFKEIQQSLHSLEDEEKVLNQEIASLKNQLEKASLKETFFYKSEWEKQITNKKSELQQVQKELDLTRKLYQFAKSSLNKITNNKEGIPNFLVQNKQFLQKLETLAAKNEEYNQLNDKQIQWTTALQQHHNNLAQLVVTQQQENELLKKQIQQLEDKLVSEKEQFNQLLQMKEDKIDGLEQQLVNCKQIFSDQQLIISLRENIKDRQDTMEFAKEKQKQEWKSEIQQYEAKIEQINLCLKNITK